jgi:hypothetical protein
MRSPFVAWGAVAGPWSDRLAVGARGRPAVHRRSLAGGSLPVFGAFPPVDGCLCHGRLIGADPGASTGRSRRSRGRADGDAHGAPPPAGGGFGPGPDGSLRALLGDCDWGRSGLLRGCLEESKLAWPRRGPPVASGEIGMRTDASRYNADAKYSGAGQCAELVEMPAADNGSGRFAGHDLLVPGEDLRRRLEPHCLPAAARLIRRGHSPGAGERRSARPVER